MAQDSIDKVLGSRKPAAEVVAEGDGDKFYSIMVGEGTEEHYLELKLRDGIRICLSYTDLDWFSYDPDGPTINLEFGVLFATIKGRGLGDALFNGIKQKRVAWVKEADTEMQDHKGNKVFIEEIAVALPKEEEASPEE